MVVRQRNAETTRLKQQRMMDKELDEQRMAQ